MGINIKMLLGAGAQESGFPNSFKEQCPGGDSKKNVVVLAVLNVFLKAHELKVQSQSVVIRR